MYIKKFIILFSLAGILNATGFPNEYYKITDTNQKKNAFFEHLYPMIAKENQNILIERAFAANYLQSAKNSFDTTSIQHQKLADIAKKYKIANIYDLNAYLNKIDIVPISMTLAQAAVESGWGTSRFTKEANNIFGHWTYSGKGLIPKKRAPGQKHMIKIFDSLQHSIAGYMRNLNRGTAYKEFRILRSKHRKEGINPRGLSLSQTMIHYSGIGEEYLRILGITIRKNKLELYDKRYYAQYKSTKKTTVS